MLLLLLLLRLLLLLQAAGAKGPKLPVSRAVVSVLTECGDWTGCTDPDCDQRQVSCWPISCTRLVFWL
jgi:hypothetical protein